MSVPFLIRGDTATRRRGRLFNKSQELWKELQGVLTDEGYTSNKSFSKAVSILEYLRELGLGDFEGEERRNFEKETQWVADLDRHKI